MKGQKDSDKILGNQAVNSNLDSFSSGDAEDGSPTSATESKESSAETVPTQEKSSKDIEKEYQEKIKELEDKFLRLVAEFDNYKKRTARQFEDIIKTANENLIVRLLDVADNFRRALEASRNSSDFHSLQKGTALIYQHLEDIMKKEGVEKIDALGQNFDPQLHEAMMQIESDKYPEGIIALEMSPGYRLNGKIIRHSKVAVSKGRPTLEEEAQAKLD